MSHRSARSGHTWRLVGWHGVIQGLDEPVLFVAGPFGVGFVRAIGQHKSGSASEFKTLIELGTVFVASVDLV